MLVQIYWNQHVYTQIIFSGDISWKNWLWIELWRCTPAREVADEYNKKTPDKPRFVAGAIGQQIVQPPCARCYDRDIVPLPLMIWRSLLDQVRGLVDGRIRFYCWWNYIDTLMPRQLCLPLIDSEWNRKHLLSWYLVLLLMLGAYPFRQTVRLSGTPSVFHLLSVGLNCALGAKVMRHTWRTFRKSWCIYIAYPNAGFTNEFGQYDETAHEKPHIRLMIYKAGLVNIVGGCCGTTPDISNVLPKKQPNILQEEYQKLNSFTPERSRSRYHNPRKHFCERGWAYQYYRITKIL